MNKSRLGWVVHRHLIDNNIIPADIPSLLEKRGYTVVVADMLRFSDALSVPIPSSVELWSAIGTIAFVKRLPLLTTFKDTNVHAFFAHECHSYMRYQNHIPREYIFNKNGFILPLSECMNRSAQDIIRMLGQEDLHIRPDNCLKVAEAAQFKVTNESWSQWIEDIVRFSGANENTLFWFFQAKKIDAEYRLVIHDNKVVASSPYPHNYRNLSVMDPSTPEEAILIANNAAPRVNISDPIYVMDIVRQGNQFFVLELNCMATSGWYKLPPDSVIKHLDKAFLHIAEELY